MKVMIADDHAMVRTGLALLLERLFGDIDIFHAGCYREALSICTEHSDLSLALVDRMMPGYADGNGLKSLCRELHPTPVVVLSASEEQHHVEEAIGVGARGFLPKSMDESLLSSALQLILAGGMYMPARGYLQTTTSPLSRDGGSYAHPQPTLTPRQHDILSRLVIGETNKDIARSLAISPATVQTHVNAIFRALSVTNRTQAAHVASALGLL